MDKEQRQVVVICAVRVYNDGMNNPIIYGFNENDGMMLAEEDVRLTELHLQDKAIPHTCEHCKFWGKPYDVTMAYCNNEVLIEMIDGGPEEPPYFHKDFGCIFWEGKE